MIKTNFPVRGRKRYSNYLFLCNRKYDQNQLPRKGTETNLTSHPIKCTAFMIKTNFPVRGRKHSFNSQLLLTQRYKIKTNFPVRGRKHDLFCLVSVALILKVDQNQLPRKGTETDLVI